MQLIDYDTTDWRTGERRAPAAIYLSDDESVRRKPLERGSQLAYGLGDRHCAGDFDGRLHHACATPTAPYCDQHTSAWPCARCTGECDKPLDNCDREHAVYLAAFAPATFKVGVTKTDRLQTRLREQGADRAAHLRTVADGRRARRIEVGLTAEFTDRVRTTQKRAGLHQPVDEQAWRDALAAFDPIETFDFDYGLALATAPVAETLLTGEVRGVKGRLLVLERNGTAYAVDLRDVIGYELHPAASARDLQASLDAF